jgi:cytosine/uracil/thiamine/allantoin permease
MAIRILAAVVAVVLLLGYLLPPMLKLKDGALAAVVIAGVAMMAVDLWQSLKSGDE